MDRTRSARTLERIGFRRGETAIARKVSVNELIALNDEMTALVRAGVPLDRALVQFGHDMPGRLGALSLNLGERLETGEDLLTILEVDRDLYPPVWRAMVEAGLRSGRLSVALEGASITLRRIAELRRAMTLALTYPAILLLTATASLLFFADRLAPVLQHAYRDFIGSDELMLQETQRGCCHSLTKQQRKTTLISRSASTIRTTIPSGS